MFLRKRDQYTELLPRYGMRCLPPARRLPGAAYNTHFSLSPRCGGEGRVLILESFLSPHSFLDLFLVCAEEVVPRGETAAGLPSPDVPVLKTHVQVLLQLASSFQLSSSGE